MPPESKEENGRRIPLTRGYFALVSPEDYERVMGHVWYMAPSGGRKVAISKIGRKTVHLHRFILQPLSDEVVDHLNGQPLDCRRENLRKCSPLENARAFKTKNQKTSSRFLGVYQAANGRWVGKIAISKVFETEIEAAEWRNEQAKKHYGGFTPMNVLSGTNSGALARLPDAVFFDPSIPNRRQTRKRCGKSGYFGVTFHKQSLRWRAVCNIGGERKCIGSFLTAEEAARHRDHIAFQEYGEMVVLNFPLTGKDVGNRERR